MESSDKIKQEIPVYLSKGMQDQLFLMQQPLKPFKENLDESTIIEAKFKSEQKKLQLAFEYETDSKYYDKMKGEDIANQFYGEQDSEETDSECKRYNKFYMESDNIPKATNSSRYMVAIIKHDQVHLIPINSILQLKPSFPHLNKTDKKPEQEPDDDEEATKVTVSFSRNKDKDATGKEKTYKSFHSLKKKEEQEPWISLAHSAATKEDIEQLLTGSNDCDNTPFYVLDQQSYLNLLFPKHVETSLAATSSKKKALSHRVSITQLKEMSLPDQLKTLMTNGKVLQFSQIIDFLRTKLHINIEELQLVRSIQTVATLVQGCWVVQSQYLYDAEHVSSNGISGSILSKARDTILAQFTENRFVERRKMVQMTRLPHEEITEILTQISKMVPRKGWEFILPYDHEFVASYPEVCTRQNLLWEAKKLNKTRRSSEKDSKPNDVTGRRRSRNKSMSSDPEGGGSESESGKKSTRGRQKRKSSESTA